MPDNTPRKIPTGGTLIVWLFLLAVAALLAMVIYTFAATDGAPVRTDQASRIRSQDFPRNLSFIG
jgi:ABC-type Fe3+ transport system permease subunit